jgi:hypothetical protein
VIEELYEALRRLCMWLMIELLKIILIPENRWISITMESDEQLIKAFGTGLRVVFELLLHGD